MDLCDRARAQDGRGDDDHPLRQIEPNRNDCQRDGADDPDEPDQETHLHTDGQEQAGANRIAQGAGDYGDRQNVEQVRQDCEDGADDESNDPTADGREEAHAKQRLKGLGAKGHAEDEAPDGQQDHEETIAGKSERQPEQNSDQSRTSQGEERVSDHEISSLQR